MRTCLLIFISLVALFPADLFAQVKMDDVIYMKDSAIYEGTIIEYTPNKTLKIEILGGSVITLAEADVKKIKWEMAAAYHAEYEYDSVRDGYIRHKPGSAYYIHRDRGYFLQAHGHAGPQIGVNVVNGYKFGRFGLLGIGVGIDGLFAPLPYNNNTSNVTGFYVPVFIYYSGDMLRSRITPFYTLSAGYSYLIPGPRQNENFGNGTGDYFHGTGGPMGAAGLGIKLYRRKIFYSWALEFTVQSASYVSDSYYENQSGGISDNHQAASVLMLIPAINFAIGF